MTQGQIKEQRQAVVQQIEDLKARLNSKDLKKDPDDRQIVSEFQRDFLQVLKDMYEFDSTHAQPFQHVDKLAIKRPYLDTRDMQVHPDRVYLIKETLGDLLKLYKMSTGAILSKTVDYKRRWKLPLSLPE